jgi:hypothetical protein
MDEGRVVSAKIPEAIYKEMVLRVPEGDRSGFIRDAVIEKLELEQRLSSVEEEVSGIKKNLSNLELLTYGKEKANSRTFCLDDLDRRLVDYLLHYKGATTPEIAEYLETNRWLILNRLRRMQKTSRKQFGKPVIEYFAGEKAGKKKAWWINENLVEE